MNSEELLKRIQEKVAQSGVSIDQIDTDKAAAAGDSNAQYAKACRLFGKDRCLIPDVAGIASWQYSMREKIEGCRVPELSSPFNQEWVRMLEAAALGGHQQALDDLLNVCEWFPHYPEKFLQYMELAAANPARRYFDEFGDYQPYSLRLADIYFRGRILCQEEKDRPDYEYTKLSLELAGSRITYGFYDKFDTKEDLGREEDFCSDVHGKNRVPHNPNRALQLYETAANLGSTAAMSRLALLYSGGVFMGIRLESPNINKAIEWFNTLKASGGYSFCKYRLTPGASDNNIQKISPCTLLNELELADAYYSSRTCNKVDLEMAAKLYSDAVDSGFTQAGEKLYEILNLVKGGTKTLASKQKPISKDEFHLKRNKSSLLTVVFAVFISSAFTVGFIFGVFVLYHYFGLDIALKNDPLSGLVGKYAGLAFVFAGLVSWLIFYYKFALKQKQGVDLYIHRDELPFPIGFSWVYDLQWAIFWFENTGQWFTSFILFLIFTLWAWSSVNSVMRVILLAITFGFPFIPFVKRALGGLSCGIIVGTIYSLASFIVGGAISKIASWILS